MRNYQTSFFVDDKIVATMGVNAIKITGKDEYASPEICIFYPDGQRNRYERVANAINTILGEPETLADDMESSAIVAAIAFNDPAPETAFDLLDMNDAAALGIAAE